MLVVSDASPINILIRIGQIDVLPALFKQVVVPTSVAEEMTRPSTPQTIRAWMDKPPAWFTVRPPSSPASLTQLRHRGERDAIIWPRKFEQMHFWSMRERLVPKRFRSA
jgi:predicted nucleic acid-binding protein